MLRTEQGMRIVPEAPPAMYQTFQIAAPVASHWRDATCEQVGCPAYLNGWRTVIDERTDLGQAQAHYIRHDRTRRHREERMPDGLTAFTFEQGQTCFDAHKARVERPELFVVRGGDWRGNPTRVEPRLHKNPDFWVEEFSENQDRVATVIERG